MGKWKVWGKKRNVSEQGSPRTFMKCVLSYLCTITAMKSGKFKTSLHKEVLF